MRLLLLLPAVALLAACHAAQPAPNAYASPAMAAAALLDADQGASRAAAGRSLPAALDAILTDGVMMPAPRGEILEGRRRVVSALAATPDSTARARWIPIRVGLSADGEHGFTGGFLLTTRADGSRAQFKYLAYWVHERGAWRVAAWRRRPIDMVALDSTMLPPVLPARLIAPASASTITAHRATLRAAESEFSSLAQQIGVGAAFAQRGTGESINMGAPTDGRFVVGADAIARAVSGGQPLNAPSTIAWSADTAIVASSGDLGITFGVIRPIAPAQPASPGASFFTIWRRVNGAWRYVAE